VLKQKVQQTGFHALKRSNLPEHLISDQVEAARFLAKRKRLLMPHKLLLIKNEPL